MNSKIYQDELTASVTQQNKITAPSNNFSFDGMSPMTFRHSTTPLLDANRITQTIQNETTQAHDSLIEKYKSDSYQAPNLTPIRVIGNGAFGK